MQPLLVLPLHADHDEMVRVIARPLQDRGLQIGLAAGVVGLFEGVGHDLEHGVDPFLVVVAGLQQDEMCGPLFHSGPQRLAALALEIRFDFLDVGQESRPIVPGRPDGNVLGGVRLHVRAAELGDFRDLFVDGVALGVGLVQPLAGYDRRGLFVIGLLALLALLALLGLLALGLGAGAACLIVSICSGVNPCRASCFSMAGVTAKSTPCSAAASAILSGVWRCCLMRLMSRRESGFSSPRARPGARTTAASSTVRTKLRRMNMESPLFLAYASRLVWLPLILPPARWDSIGGGRIFPPKSAGACRKSDQNASHGREMCYTARGKKCAVGVPALAGIPGDSPAKAGTPTVDICIIA